MCSIRRAWGHLPLAGDSYVPPTVSWYIGVTVRHSR